MSYVAIRFKVFDCSSYYKIIPSGLLNGRFFYKSKEFLCDNGEKIKCATTFDGSDLDSYYFGFPVEDSKLQFYSKSNVNNFISYYELVSSYTHNCHVNDGIPTFFSLKNDNVKYPVFPELDKDFYEQVKSPFSDEKKFLFSGKNNFDFVDNNFYLQEKKDDIKKIESRKEILDKLSERVIGQDEQLDTLVTTVLSNIKYGSYEGLKSNILIIGKPGTGKTEMCNSLSKILSVPMIKVDATKYTSSGYKGLDVLNMLTDLYSVSGNDLNATQTGIIFIDEIDKLGARDDSSGVRSTDVQQELLGLLGGSRYEFNIDSKSVCIDTSKITFVLAGAFNDIYEKFSNEDVEKSIGFESKIIKKDDCFIDKNITREDIIGSGIEPELLRRIPVIIQMNSLKKEDLKNILTKSSISNLKIWEKALLEKDNIVLKVNPSALDYIASEAQKIGGGASGLQSIVTNMLVNIRSDALDGKISDCDVIIGKNTVDDPTKYLVKKRGYKSDKKELSENDG